VLEEERPSSRHPRSPVGVAHATKAWTRADAREELAHRRARALPCTAATRAARAGTRGRSAAMSEAWPHNAHSDAARGREHAGAARRHRRGRSGRCGLVVVMVHSVGWDGLLACRRAAADDERVRVIEPSDDHAALDEHEAETVAAEPVAADDSASDVVPKEIVGEDERILRSRIAEDEVVLVDAAWRKVDTLRRHVLVKHLDLVKHLRRSGHSPSRKYACNAEAALEKELYGGCQRSRRARVPRTPACGMRAVVSAGTTSVAMGEREYLASSC